MVENKRVKKSSTTVGFETGATSEVNNDATDDATGGVCDVNHNAYETASILSHVFYFWINPIIALGNQRPLEEKDIPWIPHCFSTKVTLDRFQRYWHAEVESSKKMNRHPSARRAMYISLWRDFLCCAAAFTPCMAIMVFQPYLVNDILTIIGGTGGYLYLGSDDGIALAVILGVLSLLNAILYSASFYFLARAGYAMRSSVVASVFQKSLRLSSRSKAKHTTGKILTMISSDPERIWLCVICTNWGWGGVLLVLTSVILLIIEVGVAAVVAAGVILVMAAIFHFFITEKIGEARRRQLKYTDERVKATNEVLQGIRVIKYYAWEAAMSLRIDHLRDQEVHGIARLQLLKLCSAVLTYIGPMVVAFALFMTYLRLGGELSVPKVYRMYALLNLIRLPFALTPTALTSWKESNIAFQRLTNFLLLDEIEDFSAYFITNGQELPKDTEKELMVSLKDASFCWDSDGKTHFPCLKDLTLDIYSGDFIAVVGSVGAGKSSFVSAILGQMTLTDGKVLGVGQYKAAYVSQEHWIQNLNLKSNVLFDSQYHEKEYEETLNASQLVPDLLVLPHADNTSIGERGLNLSGGQKARVSIARALYAQNNFPIPTSASSTSSSTKCQEVVADEPVRVFIFDDSLAAVDVHVGKALFHEAINGPRMQTGSSTSCCRIVVLSSNYHLLPDFSRIVVMENGSIAMVGSFQDIANKFPQYNIQGLQDSSDDVTADEINSETNTNMTDPSLSIMSNVVDGVVTDTAGISIDITGNTENKGVIIPEATTSPVSAQRFHKTFAEMREVIEERRKLHFKSSSGGTINSEEDREKGAVDFATYASYFAFFSPIQPTDSISTSSLSTSATTWQQRLLGAVLLFLLVILFAFTQMLRVFTDLWLGLWAAQLDAESSSSSSSFSSDTSHSDSFYQTWFIVLTWSTVAFALIRGLVLVFGCLQVSRYLHHVLLTKLLQAPVNTYFDITPVGRILNRFSKDLDAMDCLLPDNFLSSLQNIFTVLAIVIVCLLTSSYFILLFLPIAIAFYLVQHYFRQASREMKRLDSIARSPIYSLFGEVLQGLSTIRAFQRERVMEQRLLERIDRQMSIFFCFYMASRWFAIRLDLISNLLVLAVALFSTILAKYASDAIKIDPNLLGIALVYSLQLTALLQLTVRIAIDTETNMTSVERLLAFCKVEPEQQLIQVSPQHGKEKENASTTTENEDAVELVKISPSNKVESSELPANWPNKGNIVISNLVMRYRPGLPTVLNGVDLVIRGGSKVGVCGRTGAGKSSLMLALFRIVESECSMESPSNSKQNSMVIIDDIDIKTVPLQQLRSKLTIIPQDPFMFSGTLRDNLDPFHQYSDQQLWEALDRVHLKDDVLEKFPLKLQHYVSERGENISVGQRQLICIARALLRSSKVIVMDEATASVDSLTDSKIQNTIREEFKDCTILTIAHRLETIADYDVIVVMDQGRVVEVGPPLELLSEGERKEQYGESRILVTGIFRGLVNELGSERKERFITIAEKKKPLHNNILDA